MDVIAPPRRSPVTSALIALGITLVVSLAAIGLFLLALGVRLDKSADEKSQSAYDPFSAAHVPTYPNSTNVQDGGDLVWTRSFETTDTADEVLVYYTQALQQQGWKEDPELDKISVTPGSHNFSKDNKLLDLQVNQIKEQHTQVILYLN